MTRFMGWHREENWRWAGKDDSPNSAGYTEKGQEEPDCDRKDKIRGHLNACTQRSKRTLN